MTLSRTTYRLVILLLILAGILLLRKPVFSQAITAAPTRFSVVIEGVAPGKGPDVLLIPGLASSRDVYAAEAKLLTAAYRLHLIQIAGFAGEPSGPNATGPILSPVVEQLHQYLVINHLQPIPVIGHSMGGLLALMLAQSHPEDVSKLLIVDTLPFYGLVFNPAATVENVAPQAQAMHDQFIATPNDQFAASSPTYTNRLVKDPEGQRLVTASSLASDRTVFANAMLEDLGTDLRPQLATIKTPMTLLYPYETAEGPADQVTTLYTTAYATKPNLKILRIDDSRHFIMYDQPAAFDKAVQTFLKP
ncbi:alpha/beta fold hydrolase [Tunturibacter empetritectus]|uniref:Pimeloyl-ACP methyl ester carboxylesterase n=1 Tax=Tunturiibacter empetritectus TaxID=3069691 RepID=A0A7W8MPX1_9BACT|nr:alpha/beta hydrolase [Edaphobacter lichenicola]MBB5316151.1 pimeloyl-ACP methyl ester carboxylesterase [Edaphobacter lichenicola]